MMDKDTLEAAARVCEAGIDPNPRCSMAAESRNAARRKCAAAIRALSQQAGAVPQDAAPQEKADGKVEGDNNPVPVGAAPLTLPEEPMCFGVHACGAIRGYVNELRAVAQEAISRMEKAEAQVAALTEQVNHWKRMYECAQTSNSYRQDAIGG